MTDYFGEKSHQVEPSVLKAFGIAISRRTERLKNWLNYSNSRKRLLRAR